MLGTKGKLIFKVLLAHRGLNSVSFFLFNPAKNNLKMALSNHLGTPIFKTFPLSPNNGGPSWYARISYVGNYDIKSFLTSSLFDGNYYRENQGVGANHESWSFARFLQLQTVETNVFNIWSM